LKKEDMLLVERCLDGDQLAYEQLVRKYRNAVYNLCRKMVRNGEEAHDLTQEAFVKTFRSLDRYNPVYAFSSWLFKITSNLCIDYIRKQRMKLFSIDDPVEGEEGPITRDLLDPGLTPDQISEKTELRLAIRDAINELPQHYRVILLLRHQEQLTYDEIAKRLEIPLGTVKARIHRAREGLKGHLKAFAA
jgi:RNA polymerase sigma factor (sigma-70 family)